jgi:hypothetical protein
MDQPPHDPSQPSDTARREQAGRSASILVMLFGGIALLLPGLCAIWGIMALTGIDPAGAKHPGMIALWTGCFAISGGGAWLIYRALRDG